MQMIYCFDAYCTWCYGFTPVIGRIAADYENILKTDVLSGGMILPKKPVPFRLIADHFLREQKNSSEETGAEFGKDFLWHLNNANESDWFPNSEKPAVALCIFKEYYPDAALSFAADIQHALFFEGRDLTDDEAYRHLLEKYSIRAEVFYEKLKAEEYRSFAAEEFDIVRQLQVSAFPSLFLQTAAQKFQLIARGFTSYELIKQRIDEVIAEAARN